MKTNPRQIAFDQMAMVWDEQVPVPSQERIDELLNGLEMGGEIIVDIGTGTGVMIPFLLNLNPEHVWAVDLSQVMLQKVKEKYGGSKKLRTIQAEAENLPFPDCCVKLILCNGVYPHFSDKCRALCEFHRILKKDGVLIINHFIGRAEINKIHSQAEAEILRVDLLEPAIEVAKLVKKVGFRIMEKKDTEELFRIRAVKTGNG